LRCFDAFSLAISTHIRSRRLRGRHPADIRPRLHAWCSTNDAFWCIICLNFMLGLASLAMSIVDLVCHMCFRTALRAVHASH
jgi:hypothetical protein